MKCRVKSMELLCIGDIAIAEEELSGWEWDPPAGLRPGEESKILFNWELPTGDSMQPQPRSSGPRLAAHPEAATVVRKWAPGIAALATNHILDKGEEGLCATIQALEIQGFATTGAGSTPETVSAPFIWQTNEGTLAILNWVFPETHPDWKAIPGPNSWPGMQAAESIVPALKRSCDWLLAFVHWSDELFPYPRPEDRKIAAGLARLGVNAIIGGHPHVVRGMESISGCPVYYSLGNYYFSDFPDRNGGWISRAAPRNRESLGVKLIFQRGLPIQHQQFSFWQISANTILDPKRRAVRRMAWTSRELNRTRDCEYAAWYQAKRRIFDRWGYRRHFGIWTTGRGGLIRMGSKILARVSR